MDDNNETQAAPARKRSGGGINAMLLPQLKDLAGQLGIKGAGSMKKAQLLDAIKAHQAAPQQDPPKQEQPKQEPRKQDPPKQDPPTQEQPKQERQPEQPKQERQPERPVQEPKQEQPKQEQPKQDQPKQDQPKQDQPKQERQGRNQGNQNKQQPNNQQPQQPQQPGNQQPPQPTPNDDLDGDEESGGRRNRRRRGRDRDRTRVGTPVGTPGQRNEPDTTILEDDVLVPAAGILDVLDNYAFVRTSGYLPGADDVYLSLSMVRRYGLRRGDAVVGQVRQPREGERKEKFNPMVRVDNVNGSDPEVAKHREDFTVAKPTHPTDRLRLETGPENVLGRVVDLVAPLGKGQRGLIVSPAGAGKTSVLQGIAASITRNFPECHLMVVLVDERPEEVTDFERSVKGEVIASAFDRPPADHTTLAELAIERAKRLVELGHDVVVLVDGLTRLARAYNLAAPASGRALPGGVEAAALYPPKRFFGAARKLEEGGSLTILATAQVDSGSPTDEVVFEAIEPTANWQLRLSHDLADQQVDPPIDVLRSGTRREEALVGAEELAILGPLRRALAAKGERDGAELLLERVRGTQTNIELLTQLQRRPL